MTEIKLKLKVPMVPKFIIIDLPSNGNRDGGFQELPSISIADLSDEQLITLAEYWKMKLLEAAKKKRLIE